MILVQKRTLGGHVVATGTMANIWLRSSLPPQYLMETLGKLKYHRNDGPFKNYIEIIGARENNLKKIKRNLSLMCLPSVTGVRAVEKVLLVKSYCIL